MKRILPFIIGFIGLLVLAVGGYLAYRYFAGGSGTITVWTISGNEQALKTVAELYHKKHPAYRIKIVPVNEQVYEFKALYALATQKGTTALPAPEVLVMPGSWMTQHRNKLVAAPDGVLDKAISGYEQPRPKGVTPPPFPAKGRTNEQIIEKDYGPIVAMDTLADNKVWGVPLNMDTLALFYDRRQISTPPKSWSEVADLAKRFTLKSGSNVTRSVIALGDSGSVDYGLDILTTLMLQTGVQMSDPKAGIATFNIATKGASAPGTNALDYYTSFAQPSRETYTWQPSLGSSIKALRSGKTLMALGYANDVPTLMTKNTSQIGVALLPQTDSSKPKVYGQYLAATVTKQAVHPEAAWDFVSFFANPDVAEAYTKEAGVLPARLDVASRFETDAAYKPFLAQVGQAVTWPKEEVQSADKALNEALALVLKKGEKPQTALDVAAKAYSAFLQSPSGVEADPKVLSLWQLEDDPNDYKSAVRDYVATDKSIRQINVSKHSASRYEWEVLNAMAARQGPDILALKNDQVHRFAPTLQALPAGLFNASDKRLSDVRYLEDNYAPAVVTDGVINGKIYAMPASLETLMLAMNTDAIHNFTVEQRDVSVPGYEEAEDKFRTGPLVWDDIKTLARVAVKRHGGDFERAYIALGTGANVAHADDIFTVLVKQYGGEISDPDRQRTGVNLPVSSSDTTIPGQQALDLVKSFAQPKNDFYTWNNAMPNSLEALADGKVMAAFVYPRDVPTILERNPKVNLKFAPLPQLTESSDPVDSASYFTLTIPLNTKKVTPAAKFIHDTVANASTSPSDRVVLVSPRKNREETPTLDRPTNNPQKIQVNSAQSFYKGNDPVTVNQTFIDLVEGRVSLEQAAYRLNQSLKQEVL